ncbi:MAG: hypothetical protein QXP80_04810 [Zestosphaera sp.]
MKYGGKDSKKGQAEVIAAMIMIPLLIVIFSAVVTNMLKTNIVGTSSLASRVRFEQERTSEEMQAVWNNKACEIHNTGSIDVKIVRIWWGNFSEREDLSDVVVKKGSKISTLNEVNVEDIELAVTSRGNLFPFKNICIQSRGTTIYNITGGMPFTSEDILNMQRLVGTDYQNKKIVTKVSGINNASVLYWSDYPEPDWYFNSGSPGWYKNIDEYASPPEISETQILGDAQYPDLDNNGINEVTLVSVTRVGKNPPYILRLSPIDLSKGGSYNINITFVDLLRTRDYVDVIAIYFKFVASLSSSPSQQIAIGTSAMLQGELGKAFASGSTAVGSYKTGSAGNVFIATGSIFFPVKAYEPYESVIVPNAVYNLTLSFTVNNPSSNPDLRNVRIEYIAVTGAELRWRP